MTDTLPDLRDRLTARAAVTPLEVTAARARLEGRLVRSARPARHGRRVLVAAVAAVVLGVLSAAVVAVVHDRPSTAPAAAAPPLPMSDWMFTVTPASLPAALSVVEYVHADRSRQIAAVLTPADAATSNHFTAVVELAADPAELGVANRPDDATDVDGTSAWVSPHPDDEYGVSGVQLVWTDASGYTGRVVTDDAATAERIFAATTVGATHPVRMPVTLAADWFPPGSRVRSYDAVGVQGVTVVVDVFDAPAVSISVARSGVFVANAQPDAATRPFASGFEAIGPATDPVRDLTSGAADLQVRLADVQTAENTLPADRLRSLLAGATFADYPDETSWFPLADGFPTD